MNIRKLMRIGRTAAWMLLVLSAGCTMQPSDAAPGSSNGAIALPPASGGTFTIHALGHMCLDFGGKAYWAPGAPVTLYWCNGTIAQEFDVKEVLGAGHDVTLHVGDGTDNDYCIGARGGQPVAGALLEMQVCDGSDAQQFALDGDSIIAGPRPGPVKTLALITLPPVGGSVRPIERQLVARPLDDVTNAKTPIVLEPRRLTTDEDLRFVATDGSSRPPHSGFVTPTSGAQLQLALESATWGTVVEVPDGTTLDMHGLLDTNIPAGVTLRGDRRLTNNGPIVEDSQNESGELFQIAANDVRVTGLRFQGATWGTGEAPELAGLRIQDGYRVTVDHNEFSKFTMAALAVFGSAPADLADCSAANVPAQPRPTPVRISGNFLHHNIAKNQGYGVAVDDGGFPLVERNVAYMNRHSITSAYDVASGYVATDNLVLHQAPDYGPDHTANFDVHGSASTNCADRAGGWAGDYVVIQYNTLLSTDRPNVKIRGESCRTGLVDGNMFSEGPDVLEVGIGVPPIGECYFTVGGAVVNLGTDGFVSSPPPHLDVTTNNAYSQPAPAADLAVGDFDGDGVDDLFTATGTGWFYSSGGQSEWRWLRRTSDRVPDLRFGDLDGDGRTDVLRASGSTLQVSWGGVSGWQTLTTTPAALPISSYAIGNFDGDRLHGDDIFATDGATWYVAKNGHDFVPTQTSSMAASELRFGDFDGDGKTDVFAIEDGHWAFSSDAVGSWQPLVGAPDADGLDGLLVGDFDGDGHTDIGRYYSASLGIETTWYFEYSPSARATWNLLRTTSSPAKWSGRFRGSLSDLVWWDGDEFDIGAGTAASAKLSRQSMK